MVCKRLCIAVLVIMIFGAVSAVAQDEKNEVGGTIGRIFISDQGIQNATYPGHSIHYGKGLTFDVDYARRIRVTPIWAVAGEVIFAYNPDLDVNAGSYGFSVVPSDLKQIFVTPAARFNLFPTTGVSPWVSFGVGFAHTSQDSQLLYGGTNPGKSTTSAAIQGGVGLDVKATNRLYIRGGVRDFWAGTADFPLAPTGKSRQHNYYVFAGAFWRF
jgi:Outer membrane protein beta-barrel domain